MKLELRFFLVLVSIFVIAASFVVLQRHFEIDRTKSVLSGALTEQKYNLHQLVVLERRAEKTFVDDYSFWDDLVSFVKHDNIKFAKENLDTGLSTFSVDADWVYRPDGSLLYFSSADGSDTLKNTGLPAAFFTKLDATKTTHFYRYVNGKLVAFQAATIVPSDDPDHKTAAKGYLMAGRVLDAAYLNTMAGLTNDKVAIAGPSDYQNNTTANTVSFGEQFQDWNGQPVAVLRATATVPVIKDLKNQFNKELQLLVAFMVLVCGLVVLLIWWLVLRPIQLIDRSIKLQQPAMLEKLKKQRTEFGRLAQTVTEFFQQKVNLAQSEFKNEELEKLNKDKASFLAVAAHQLNTPVSNVKTFAEYLSYLLSNHSSEAEIMKQLDRISRQSIRMSMLVGDLRTASTGNQNLEFNMRDFDFDDFLLEEVADMKFSTKNKLEVKSDTNVQLHSDPDRLGQVISNLIRNARKYSPEGGDIIVRGTLQGDKIVVSVHDSGIGIGSEDLQHLFERFFRSENVRSKYPGLGLDLYMSKNIIEALGGTIWVTSELGKGSIFYFSLPLKQTDLPAKPDEIAV